MKRKYYFISLLLFCIGMPLHGYAQHKLDSLNAVLKTEKDDTNKVNTLHELSRFYFKKSNFNLTDSFARVYLKLSQKIGFIKGIADGYHGIGTVYMYSANYPESMNYSDSALAMFKKIDNKNGIANELQNIALDYFYEGEYPKALDYNLQSLKMYENLGDKKGMLKNYINIAYIYENQNDYTSSLRYDSLSLRIAKDIKDLHSAAIVYVKMGVTFIEMNKNYKEALKSLNTSLSLSLQINDKRSISIAYLQIGSANGDMKNYDTAFKYLQLSLKVDEETGDIDGMVTVYRIIGAIFTNQKKFKDAKIWLDKGFKLSQGMKNIDNIRDFYERYTILDTATGNFKAAYHDFTKYTELSDSLINGDNIKKMAGEQAAYAFGKKQDSIKAVQLRTDLMHEAETKRQKIITYSVLMGLILVLLLAFSIFRSLQQNKKKTLIIEKEKQRSEELLLNILPAEVAEELKEKGSADAKHFNEVTVMFTDFKGFTTLGEKLSPKDLVAEINHCFVAYDNIIHNYGIEKIKTIGDSYMAVCGLPNPDNQHAEKVVNACRDIIKFMEEYKEERTKQGQPYFEARVGINTGPVVAGIVGVKKFAYDIWGDTVNIASRMESSGEVGKINISGSTYELVKDKFKCFHRGKIQAKNKGEIDMYFVES